jgi:copper(I)-binding protein
MRIGSTNLFHVLAMTALAVLVGVAVADAAPLTVTGGWFRALPAAVPSGGYFTLHNGAGKPVTLTGARSPACGSLMLHRSMNHGGMGMMEHVGHLTIAPGDTLTFAPGGYHLMCMGSKPILKPGGSVPVTLVFADGRQITARFAVRGATGK